MKKALILTLGLLFCLSAFAQDLTRWSGTTFTQLEGKAACDSYIQELTGNLSQVNPKRFVLLESACVSRGEDKGYSPKLTYQSRYFQILETYSWKVQDADNCLTELAEVTTAFNNSSLSYGAGRCPKRVNLQGEVIPTGFAEIAYIAENSQNIKSITFFNPDFEIRENCLQTMNAWGANFQKNNLDLLRTDCSSFTKGLGTKKFYSPNMTFVMPLGNQLQTLAGPIGESCRPFISEETLNENQLPYLLSYCQKVGDKMQEKVYYLDDLLSSVRRYNGLTYDNEMACAESLAALSLNLNSRKYKVLSQFCEKTGKNKFRPSLYHMWKQTITKP